MNLLTARVPSIREILALYMFQKGAIMIILKASCIYEIGEPRSAKPKYFIQRQN